MEMTREEIRRNFLEAKNKLNQIYILSDLNDCQVAEIAELVRDVPFSGISQVQFDKMISGKVIKNHRENDGRDAFYQSFSEKLSKEIENRGISRRDLSKKTDIDLTSLAYYLNGKRIPNLYSCKRIAEALDVSIEYLLEDEDDS